MAITTGAIDGFSFEASKVTKSQLPLSFENKDIQKVDASFFFFTIRKTPISIG